MHRLSLRRFTPGCLKLHFDELLAQFPNLKILTGDTIFAQRPLLRVLKDKVDYVFQVKDNQAGVLDGGLGGEVYVFVESGGQCWQLAEKGKGAVDGCGGYGEGQA